MTATLTAALVGHDSLTKKVLLVLGGTLVIALAAKVSVPMFPVPMTLQTLAVLVVGLTFGARLGAATLAAYLAQGAMGLPVFSPTTAPGLAAFAGPTAGFLLGFLLMAAVAGWASDRGWTRSLPGALFVALGASLLLYVPGLAWPAAAMGMAMPELLSGWMLPFLAGDAVKAVLAALVVTGGWAALRARSR
ncbi:MAG: biotin transporter BioY [Rhodobacteraceae bacterium]|jgi:biotin transport system substrate-specific component|nr:biotin transporter BioY [Paracoccaceae bacterium]